MNCFFYFDGSGFVFWESNMGEGEMRKEKMVGMGSAGMLNRRVWPLYRYGSHKKVENLTNDKLSNSAKQTSYKEFGYFKWWVMSDENWVMSDEW